MFYGMVLPIFQVGDQVRPGMAVAEIPDLKNWEVTARRSGNWIAVICRWGSRWRSRSCGAADTQAFKGHVKEVGGTTGNPWDRHFDCRIAVDDPVRRSCGRG